MLFIHSTLFVLTVIIDLNPLIVSVGLVNAAVGTESKNRQVHLLINHVNVKANVYCPCGNERVSRCVELLRPGPYSVSHWWLVTFMELFYGHWVFNHWRFATKPYFPLTYYISNGYRTIDYSDHHCKCKFFRIFSCSPCKRYLRLRICTFNRVMVALVGLTQNDLP